MSEQSGRGEPADRAEPGRSRGADRPESGRSQQAGRRQQGSDLMGDLQRDLQRWLIRSSARNMRSQFEDQVRRTLGGQRPDNSDVWDVATTEIPPEVGESPECQWCPICRAARRMRDSRPGLAGQLSGAGDTVAGAVQDAVRAFDTILGRTGGGSGAGRTPDSGPADSPANSPPEASGQQPEPGTSDQPDSGGAGASGRPDSMAGEHGPVGWKPGDRLATAGAAVADPWAMATEPGETDEGSMSGGGVSDTGTDGSRSSDSSNSGEPDGQGHGPSDRG